MHQPPGGAHVSGSWLLGGDHPPFRSSPVYFGQCNMIRAVWQRVSALTALLALPLPHNMPEPAELPIRKYSDSIVNAVKSNNVVVVIGETGSGKTTQLSQVGALQAAPCSGRVVLRV